MSSITQDEYRLAHRVLDMIAGRYAEGVLSGPESAEDDVNWSDLIKARRLVIVEARKEHGDEFATHLIEAE